MISHWDRFCLKRTIKAKSQERKKNSWTIFFLIQLLFFSVKKCSVFYPNSNQGVVVACQLTFQGAKSQNFFFFFYTGTIRTKCWQDPWLWWRVAAQGWRPPLRVPLPSHTGPGTTDRGPPSKTLTPTSKAPTTTSPRCRGPTQEWRIMVGWLLQDAWAQSLFKN
jgi:hypothetical protein